MSPTLTYILAGFVAGAIAEMIAIIITVWLFKMSSNTKAKTQTTKSVVAPVVTVVESQQTPKSQPAPATPKVSWVVTTKEPAKAEPVQPKPDLPKPDLPFNIRYRYSIDGGDKYFDRLKDVIRELDAAYYVKILGRHVTFGELPDVLKNKINRERIQ